MSPNGTTARQTCITYNIHSGIGADKRYDLERIRRILADEQPQIVALQEIECGVSRSSFDDQSSALAQGLGLSARFCPARRAEDGDFGMAVLSPFSRAAQRALRPDV